MSRTTFEIVVNHIGHSHLFHKRDKELGGRKQIGPEKALLVTLWTLATPDSYRSIGERFGIAKSSVYFCLQTVINVILHELTHRFIKWPTEDETVYVANRFAKYGLPKVIGVIDGCHIPIKKPVENSIDYFNRKKFYSMVLQGVCKPDLTFIDCDIRWPGSVHDGRVLRTSDIYPIAEQLCRPNYYVIGDSAYPLKKWLITPYRNNGHLLPQQVYFNRMLAKTRVVIENTFALLKGRFRRLKDYLDRDKPEDIIQTVMAACTLHNICLVEGEDEVEQYILEGRDDDHAIPMVALYNQNDNEAAERRDELCRTMWHNNNIL
ncbi:Putative nuclease HARBI1-like Protein [Tribolium castaneum]|uniref:Nuclease HARBI1-like Protein n=1 Tax=Tribolium castaneum TaxID=7070 RepID=D6WE71_TRICA|nr:PREDICTED: putative nuclease HARBI1 isoform X2 [Tribolium castaneum]EFA01169.1 Putative nuclease HARBI1-like Protein [Tribolium castaneum]|eukprot:XP_015833674.1 PREDICTED: putative nuclease HARBI1 isoform X2 [Tribolium castaneum]